jgi:DNA-binding NtrC family response regulator
MTPADAPRDTERPSTLLVVDDDVLVRMTIGENLREAGFRVVEAANGHEALGVMLSDIEVDLLLTDLRMPGALDGFGLGMAARGQRPELRVLVMSSFLPESTGARLSPFEFIEKPFRPQTLIERVRAMLEAAGE